ncbi:MAG: hypothetical protein ABSD99_02855 [Candidatus Bathyarchaeia archaeon]|jgi:hypothetical protein
MGSVGGASDDEWNLVKSQIRLPSGFCSRCGCPIDVKSAMQLHEEESKTDDVMDWLVDDPEFRQLLRSKLRAMAMTMAT